MAQPPLPATFELSQPSDMADMAPGSNHEKYFNSHSAILVLVIHISPLRQLKSILLFNMYLYIPHWTKINHAFIVWRFDKAKMQHFSAFPENFLFICMVWKLTNLLYKIQHF